MTDPLLRLDGVSRVFEASPDLGQRVAAMIDARHAPKSVRAVDDVTLDVHPGEVLGLVGESGCGKSTLSRIAAGILRPSAGRVVFEGHDVAGLRGRAAREAALAVQMVFQDPMSSLNPRMRVGEIVGEAPLFHGLVSRRDLAAHVDAVMERVGLDPSWKARYPHQFSGGQRQRIGIARALAVRPRLLICDEAVAALDVSIQAQILNLLAELRRDLGLTCLFVSHDLGVVEHISDRVAVMYLGRLVEEAPAERLFAAPRHPYTEALLAERPVLAPGRREFSPLEGEIPSPLTPPPGCHFHPRCPQAVACCREAVPRPRAMGPGHAAACHLAEPDREAA